MAVRSDRRRGPSTRASDNVTDDDVAVAALSRLRNLGQASARLLVGAGIRSPQALRALGAAAAFRQVLFTRSGRASTNLLWALEGALRNERWDRLDVDTREHLRAQIEGGCEL